MKKLLALVLVAMAIGVAVTGRGARNAEAEYQLTLDLACSPNGAIVYFYWTGNDPAATQQWVDLSLFDNGWQPGTFAGAGPFAASATAHTWDGLVSNAVHYVRINQQLPSGQWLTSPTYYFTTPDCAGGSAPAPAPSPTSTPAAQRNVFDMIGGHDGRPLGVPTSFDWYTGPQIHRAHPPAGYNAMLGWGQVYSDVGQPHPPENLRIQIAGLQIYGLVNGTWQTLQSDSNVGGSYFAANYQGLSVQALERNEAGGGISVTPYAGRPYHFFPDTRVGIPSGLEGVVVAVQARLIMDNPAGPDNREQARLMMGAGLDWFGGLAGPTKANGACVGPMIWLTSEYQTFVCHTFTNQGALEANPPPLP